MNISSASLVAFIVPADVELLIQLFVLIIGLGELLNIFARWCWTDVVERHLVAMRSYVSYMQRFRYSVKLLWSFYSFYSCVTWLLVFMYAFIVYVHCCRCILSDFERDVMFWPLLELFYHSTLFVLLAFVTKFAVLLEKNHNKQQQQLFYGPLSGTTRVSRYQKKHSPTHHPDHHRIFISFFQLPRSIASSVFKLRAWQSFCTTSLHVLFGLFF